MAEAIVTSTVNWISSILIREANSLFEVSDQVESLQKELQLMQCYLQDADARARQAGTEVHSLVQQIRTFAYASEDAIDSYILKVQAKTSNEGWLKKYACILYNSPQIYQAGEQIQKLLKEMERITQRLNGFGVRKAPERLPSDEGCRRRQPQSYGFEDINRDYIVGLDKDISKLLDVLMGEENTRINFVCIVGMGGCGKTTLARKLYNHPYVGGCFNCMVWVFISQKWSTIQVLSEIWRMVGSHMETSEQRAKLTEPELVEKLQNTLQEKLYLVVLDDVWRRDALEDLLPALPWGNKGSKIIITTRNQEITRHQKLQQHIYIHKPEPLSEVESWELFNKIALSHCTHGNLEDFHRLGKAMLKKCGGLPLAIEALAGILNSRDNIGQWQEVSEAVGSRVMDDDSKRVEDLIALSYDDLPNYLKPCFLYLGVFPEDCQIPAGLLTRMWVAEGLVVGREKMSPEDVAMQHLEELSQRFMIQILRVNYKGAIKTVHFHDILRELCLRKAKEQGFLQVSTGMNDHAAIYSTFDVAIQPRRVAIHSSCSFPTQVSNLRSLVLLTRSSIHETGYACMETIDPEIVHKTFKLLRLLNLWDVKTDNGTLPMQIGSLIHLRYLGIHTSNITELPTSIGKLRNLLTLDYRSIVSDSNAPIKIPNGLSKLDQLRHLYLPFESPWSLMHLQLSSMKNLQVLSGVKQNAGSTWLSTELPRLSSTVKKLKIAVSTEEELRAAFTCPSLMSDRLLTFHCELSDGLAFQGVESISNLQRLGKLKLTGVVGMKLSLLLPVNLLTLELKDSMLKDEDSIVALGALAHLKLLRLSNFFIGAALALKPDSFPQLEELCLENLQNLQTLTIGSGALPCLKKLELASCPYLQELPQGIESVTTLQELEYFEMPVKFCENAVEMGWGDNDVTSYAIISSHRDRIWKQKRRSYPYEDGKCVIGLEDDIQNLVDLLTGEDKSHVCVFSIAGMGGSGKTTLARKLYNHPKVKESFDCMAWVFISPEWSPRHILSQILRKIRGPKETNKILARFSVEKLMDRLHNALNDQSFLVVLDDLWTRKALEEMLLVLPWRNTKRRSKIIITSRNRDIVELPHLQQHLYIHELQPLNDEDSWMLFKTISSNKSFKEICNKLVTKCNGLPLALIALAEILENIRVEEWNTLSDDIVSRVMDHTCTNMYGSVHDLLAISYDELTENLKPCFLFLGQFPKPCELSVGMLTRMWIAEDLVLAQEHRSAEEVASQILEDLSKRSMILAVRRDFEEVIKAIHLHDLLRELCIRIAKEGGFFQNFGPINNLIDGDVSALPSSCRAVLHSSTEYLPIQCPNLRSLLVLSTSSITYSPYSPKKMLDLEVVSHHFKMLKLLNIWGVQTSDRTIPSAIGSLIHLRYLGIRATNITRLPTSIGNLSNLLTLDYKTIDFAGNVPVQLPEGLSKLALLKHLFLPIKYCWSPQKPQLGALKNLEILWGIRCGEWSFTKMPELIANLKKLKVVLSKENDWKDAFDSPCLEFNKLHTFHCRWTGITLELVYPIFQNNSLRKLFLNGDIRVKKLSDILPPTLVKLELKNSNLETDPMVSIGALAHLKILKMSNSFLGTVFVCKSHSFSVLEELYLDCHSNLNTWVIEKGAMPCLKKLLVGRCKKLWNFPQGWPFAATLMQLKFFDMTEEFIQRARDYGFSEPLKLPRHVASVIDCDTAIDISSSYKIYKELSNGVFLNNKTQKYWVIKQSGQYCNAFMLYASCLSLRTEDYLDILDGFSCSGYRPQANDCWEWSQMEESDGAFITVGKVMPDDYALFEVDGEFNDTKSLSMGVKYEIAFVVMLSQRHVRSVKCRLQITDGHYIREGDVSHNLNVKPKNEWIKLFVGYFNKSSVTFGQKLSFSMGLFESGMIIKGVVIEPILEDSQ